MAIKEHPGGWKTRCSLGQSSVKQDMCTVTKIKQTNKWKTN